MKIISHFNATTTVDATWDEVRPLTGGAFPATVQFIKERYSFQIAGQSAISQQIGLMTPSFQAGQFKIGDQSAPINLLEFQPQAVIISCATTTQTSKFYDDLFSFLKALEYRSPTKERPRRHVTSIVVDFGASLAPLFEGLSKIQSMLNKMVGGTFEFTPLSIRFGVISPENQILPEPQYVFERRAVAPAGESWIFSQAPLDTDSHVALLSAIDSVLND
jgi:hypothetical protein